MTFQARDLAESRHLYDHLAVLSPIMLALTAATPVLHGRIADTDVRWDTIAASVDDRTAEERGEDTPPRGEAEGAAAAAAADGGSWSEEDRAMLAGRGRRYLPKSRYDSISVYLADCVDCHDKYQDLDPPVATGALPMLLDAGVDKHLARHIAHLFVRDPLVIRPDRIHLNDTIETDHFEILQSTNWQTVRWKPPPKGRAPLA